MLDEQSYSQPIIPPLFQTWTHIEKRKLQGMYFWFPAELFCVYIWNWALLHLTFWLVWSLNRNPQCNSGAFSHHSRTNLNPLTILHMNIKGARWCQENCIYTKIWCQILFIFKIYSWPFFIYSSVTLPLFTRSQGKGLKLHDWTHNYWWWKHTRKMISPNQHL